MLLGFQRIHRELLKDTVTLSPLWKEYCAESQAAGKIPYITPPFSNLYRK